MPSDPDRLRAFEEPLPDVAVPDVLAEDAAAQAREMLDLLAHPGWSVLCETTEKAAEVDRTALATGVMSVNGRTVPIDDEHWQDAQARLRTVAIFSRMEREARTQLLAAEAALALSKKHPDRLPGPSIRSEQAAREIIRRCAPQREMVKLPAWKRVAARLVQRAWAHRQMAASGTREDARIHRAMVWAIRTVLMGVQNNLDAAAKAEAYLANKAKKKARTAGT